MYKLGIIGGMGPDASELLYHKINKKTDAGCDQEHIDMVILNHPTIPDRTRAILEGEEHKVISALKDDCRILSDIGVSYIAVPCNTSHCFFSEVQKTTSATLINMIEETVLYAKTCGFSKAGIMCTDGTLKAGMYEKECLKHSIGFVKPTAEMQNTVMDIIYNQVKKGGKGNLDDFLGVAEMFKKMGCDCVFIACTELSCVLNNYDVKDSFYVDALDVLAEKSIIVSGGNLRDDT